MEGAKVIRDQGDWMASIDLKDAVPIAQALPQVQDGGEPRLASAVLPGYIFTKLLKPVVALLRRRGIRCILFLDDMLLRDQSRRGIESYIVSFLQLLGFQINWTKSVLVPSQIIQYLGW